MSQVPPLDLVRRAREVSRLALASGALVPIPTAHEIVEEQGIRFQLRVIENLERKEAARAVAVASKQAPRSPVNPFLPYDEELFVADVGPSHVALLNKFNVLGQHLLIVTRELRHQEEWLDLTDFVALARCLREVDGLAFYNGGEAAGASQPHKHLQLVPLPLASGEPSFPVSSLLERDGIVPYRQAVVRLDADVDGPAEVQATRLLASYSWLLREVGLLGPEEEPRGRQRGPYNLIVTRQWMVLVPRVAEFFETISVNALGFAGSLFARNPSERDRIREVGPLAALRHVGVGL